jgi:hypothetical protein
MQLYRMHDAPDASKAAIPVADAAEARTWNTPEKGFGIFRTVNSFDGPRRKEFLARIVAWPIDIDEGDKADQANRLMAAPLSPTAIVETRRGYQAYWAARDGASASNWNAIVLERLVPYFGADRNARDLCRILRAPNYLHLKDPTQPFKVTTVWRHMVAYSERQMGEAFPWVPNMDEHRRQLADAQQAAERERREKQRAADVAAGLVPTETFWEAVERLDAHETLARLSGSHYVSGEVYTFKRNANGNTNLIVDGNGSSVFIDPAGKIGSSDGGGPTPAQWLRWFKHPWPIVIEALKWAHPHLAQIDEANRARERAEYIAKIKRSA